MNPYHLLGIAGLLILFSQFVGGLIRAIREESEERCRRSSPVIYVFDDPSNSPEGK